MNTSEDEKIFEDATRRDRFNRDMEINQAMKKKFTEDQIRRTDLPHDVFGLIHDLCYHHEGRDVGNYVARAQEILRKRPGQLDHSTIAEMRAGFEKVSP